jgi:hypothetical protein
MMLRAMGKLGKRPRVGKRITTLLGVVLAFRAYVPIILNVVSDRESHIIPGIHVEYLVCIYIKIRA